MELIIIGFLVLLFIPILLFSATTRNDFLEDGEQKNRVVNGVKHLDKLSKVKLISHFIVGLLWIFSGILYEFVFEIAPNFLTLLVFLIPIIVYALIMDKAIKIFLQTVHQEFD